MLANETEVEGVNPNGAQLSWHPPLRHFRQSMFLLLDLNSLCMPRIALANRIGAYLFYLGWKVKRVRKYVYSVLMTPSSLFRVT